MINSYASPKTRGFFLICWASFRFPEDQSPEFESMWQSCGMFGAAANADIMERAMEYGPICR